MRRRRNLRPWLVAAVLALAVAPACSSRPAPGERAAKLDYVLKDMNGRTVRLADFKGRPMLVNFWATWCSPCKAEIPWFVEFADKYQAQNLAVIGISVDDEPQAIREFAAQYKVNYPMLVGSGQDDLIAQYEAGLVVPVTWLIRPNGTLLVKAQGIHAKDWFEKQIEEIAVVD